MCRSRRTDRRCGARSARFLAHQLLHDGLAFLGRLQEGFRRQRHGKSADTHGGRRRHRNRLAVPIEPREIQCRRQVRQRHQQIGAAGAFDLQRKIDAGLRRRGMQLRRFARLQNPRELRLQRPDQPGKRGNQHGTFGDVDQAAALRFVESQGYAAARIRARLEHRAPPRARRHRANLFHRHIGKAALLERVQDQIALPGEIGPLRHHLQGAAAAAAEMGTNRLGPRWTRRDDSLQAAARTLADRRARHRPARYRARTARPR